MGTFIYKHLDKEYIVNVIHKRTNYIRYKYRDDQFFVTAPLICSNKKISEGIDKYYKKLVIKNPSVSGLTDDYIYILGNKFDIKNRKDIPFSDGTSITFSNKEELMKKLQKWFLTFITSRNRYYEKLMNIPQYKVSVRSMNTRYGSNSISTHSIRYSLILLHYSIEIIDSVVVHELAHHYVRNHSKDFYDVVFKYYPNYKKCHKMLKDGVFK